MTSYFRGDLPADEFEIGDWVEVCWTGQEYAAGIKYTHLTAAMETNPHKVTNKLYIQPRRQNIRYRLEGWRYVWPPHILKRVKRNPDWSV